MNFLKVFWKLLKITYEVAQGKHPDPAKRDRMAEELAHEMVLASRPLIHGLSSVLMFPLYAALWLVEKTYPFMSKKMRRTLENELDYTIVAIQMADKTNNVSGWGKFPVMWRYRTQVKRMTELAHEKNLNFYIDFREEKGTP